MKTPIDLGQTSPDCCAVPCSPKDNEKKTYYPSLYIDGGPELSDLPESGIMEIAFKRNSLTKTDRDGVKKTSVSLDVLKILEVEADVSTGAAEANRGDMLDKMAADVADESTDE